ncbi:hypothetical protein ABZX85_12115 [Streptomyces sp. NPDC004539]|uniref:hypothetical protein n=1 Tax=Streptomyces sp. NPDC004539 TaxID=3154280 RepID=UPI0033A44CC6
MGRRTLAVSLGRRRVRAYLRTAFVVCAAGYSLPGRPSALLGLALVQAALSAVVGRRLSRKESCRAADHTTYTLLVHWYITMAAALALLL